METAVKYPDVKNYINGQFEVNGEQMMDVFSPIDGEIISHVPLSGFATFRREHLPCRSFRRIASDLFRTRRRFHSVQRF